MLTRSWELLRTSPAIELVQLPSMCRWHMIFRLCCIVWDAVSESKSPVPTVTEPRLNPPRNRKKSDRLNLWYVMSAVKNCIQLDELLYYQRKKPISLSRSSSENNTKSELSYRKQPFLWKYPNPETINVPCFNVSRMPNRRTSQSKIEDIVHCKCISLLN